MFSNLSEKLIGVLGALTRKGFLKDDDVISKHVKDKEEATKKKAKEVKEKVRKK